MLLLALTGALALFRRIQAGQRMAAVVATAVLVRIDRERMPPMLPVNILGGARLGDSQLPEDPEGPQGRVA